MGRSRARKVGRKLTEGLLRREAMSIPGPLHRYSDHRVLTYPAAI
jgi:hypothetical protein